MRGGEGWRPQAPEHPAPSRCVTEHRQKAGDCRGMPVAVGREWQQWRRRQAVCKAEDGVVLAARCLPASPTVAHHLQEVEREARKKAKAAEKAAKEAAKAARVGAVCRRCALPACCRLCFPRAVCRPGRRCCVGLASSFCRPCHESGGQPADHHPMPPPPRTRRPHSAGRSRRAPLRLTPTIPWLTSMGTASWCRARSRLTACGPT